MTRHQTPESIGFLLTQINKTYRALMAGRLSDLGLHPGQESLLCQIWQQDGLTQGELAERLGVQPATVSKMLSRMDSAGLIAGCRDAADARITRLHLTEAGRALHQPIQEAWNDVEERMLAGFTMEERVLLRRLLMAILANLTAAGER